MLKRVFSILVGISLLVALAFFVMPALIMHCVPTPAQVGQRTDILPLQVLPASVEGVYGNDDIDALVFRYTTGAPNEVAFKTQLDKQAAAAGWTSLPNAQGAFRFERITPKGNQVFCGAEEVRVKLNPASQRVGVGWVQGDSIEDVASFSDTHESDWAKSNVWPKMDGT